MASKRIQGITIEIGGDTTKLQTALKSVDTELRKTQGNLKDINKLLKLDPGNTELLVQKQKNIQESIKATEERLKTLKSTQTDSLSPEEYDNLQREIIDTEQRLGGLEDEYKAIGSVAKQKIVAVAQAMQDVGEKVSDFGRRMQEVGNVVPNKLKEIGSAINEHVLQPMMEVAKVVGAAGIGVTTALTKGAVDAAAEYEQLAGGIETLFGKSSAKVIKNANRAFKTSGQSVNDYMKTVTSFSASLLRSLGGDTDKAARMADMAIQDMSDNANKFGMDFASIEAAYRGFSKEQYNLLDNLSLGYAGTKAGMEQLIRDAEKLDTTFKVTHNTVKKGKAVNDELAYSYDDIIKAIHIIQTNMGVTGTTAAEASKTIEGSMAAAKAAWSNLLTAIGTGGDVKEATKNVLSTAGTYLKENVLPTIKESLNGITTFADEVWEWLEPKLPEIKRRLVNWLNKKIPEIPGDIAAALVNAFYVIRLAISGALAVISAQLSKWITGDYSLAGKFRKSFLDAKKDIEEALGKIGGALSRLWTDTLEPYLKDELKAFITDTLPKLTGIIGEIADGIAGIIDWFNELDPETKKIILDVLEAIVIASLATSGIGKVIEKGGDLIKGIGTLITFLSGPGGIVAAIGAAIFAGIMIVKNWDAIKEKAKEVGEWISQHVEEWINAATEWFDKLNTELDTAIKNAGEWLKGLGEDIKTGFEEAKTWIKERVKAITDALDTAIKDAGEWFTGLGKDIKAVWDEYFQPVVDWLGEKFNGAIEAIQPALEGITKFLTDVFTGNWESAWNKIVDLFGKIFGKIGDKMKEPINAVIDGLNWMIDKIEGAINSVIGGINKHLSIHLDPIYDPIFGAKIFDGLDWSANLKKVNWGRIDKLMANGGILGEGKRAIVGEYAPEYLRVVNGRAVVTPITNQPGRMGGDTNVNITINTQPGQSAEDIAAAVKRVFVREMQQREAAYA